MTVEQTRRSTCQDPELSPVVQFLKQGWPRLQSSRNSQFASFLDKRDELSLYEGCILWGTRVVVPVAHRDAVLIELHEGHPGMVRMKELAPMYVWWQ